MRSSPSILRFRLVQSAGIASRWLVGALFIYMGLNKALHPVEFLKLVRQYDLVQYPLLLNVIAALLPWFEVFCGMLLALGIAVRGSAAILMAMLIPFTIVVFHRALLIHSAQAIPFCAVKFDCGCGAGEVFVCRKVMENILLILITGWLLAGSARKFCLRYDLFKLREEPASPDA
jgi:uncharacterized membrane protein YphA (DoxX/SURF4 family)